MLVFVVICNLLIALVNLFIAWKIWQLRQVLAKLADILIAVELTSRKLLSAAPAALAPGKKRTRNLKESYRQLKLQLQLLRQILTFLGLVNKIWQGQFQHSKYGQQLGKLVTEKLNFAPLEYPNTVVSKQS